MAYTGGKFYGEGMKGYVEDARCIKDDDRTFCRWLESNQDEITKAELYSNFKKLTIDATAFKTKVVPLIRSSKNIVAKTFKGENPKDYFLNELRASKIVAKTLPDHTYHTVAPGFVYDGMPVYGLVLHKKETTTYHIFSEGCSTQILDVKFDQKLFDKFIKDILEGFDKIHAAGLYHNDVKPDNMIYCGATNRFKIIDWELAAKFSKTPTKYSQSGTTLYNHPMKFYIGGLPAFISRLLPSYSLVIGKHKWVKELKAWPHIKQFITNSFDFAVASNCHLTKEQLHKKFAPHYDNFAFALTILFLADKHQLKVPKGLVAKLMGPFVPSPF